MLKSVWSKTSFLGKFLIVSLAIAGLLFLSVRLNLIRFPTTQAVDPSFEMVIYPSTIYSYGGSANPNIALHAKNGFSGNVNLTFTSVNLPLRTMIQISSINDHLNWMDVPDYLFLPGDPAALERWAGTAGYISEISKINIPIGTNQGENEWNAFQPTIMIPGNGTYTINVTATGGGQTKTGQIQITKSSDTGNYASGFICTGETNKKSVTAGSSVNFNMCVNSNYSGTVNFSSEAVSATGLSLGFTPSSLAISPATGYNSNNYTFNIATTSSTPNGYYMMMAKNTQSGREATNLGLRVKITNSSVPAGSSSQQQTTDNNQQSTSNQSTTNNQQTTTTNAGTSSPDTSTTGASSTTTTTATTSAQKAATALATRGTDAKVEENSTAVLTLDKSSGYPGSKVKLTGEKFQKNKELLILWDPYPLKIDNQDTQKSKYDFKKSEGSALVITTDKDGKFTQEITIPSNMISGYKDTHTIKIGNAIKNSKIENEFYTTEIYAEGTFNITEPTAEEKAANPEAKTPLTKSEVISGILYQKSTGELSSDKEKTSIDLLSKSTDKEEWGTPDNFLSVLIPENYKANQFSGGVRIGGSSCSYHTSQDLSKTKSLSESVNRLIIPGVLADSSCMSAEDVIQGNIDSLGSNIPISNSPDWGALSDVQKQFMSEENLGLLFETLNSKSPWAANNFIVGLWEGYTSPAAQDVWSRLHGTIIIGYGLLNQQIPGNLGSPDTFYPFMQKTIQVTIQSPDGKTKTKQMSIGQLITIRAIRYCLQKGYLTQINKDWRIDMGIYKNNDLVLYYEFGMQLKQTPFIYNNIFAGLKELVKANYDFDISFLNIPSGHSASFTSSESLSYSDIVALISAAVKKVETKNKSSAYNEAQRESDVKGLAFFHPGNPQPETKYPKCFDKIDFDVSWEKCMANKYKIKRYTEKIKKISKEEELAYWRWLKESEEVYAQALKSKAEWTKGYAAVLLKEKLKKLDRKIIASLPYSEVAFGMTGGPAAYNNSPNKSLVDFTFSGKAYATEENIIGPSTSTNYIQIDTKDSKVGLLITDPTGRNIGYNPLAQKDINQIQGAEYSNPLEENSSIFLPGVLFGDYDVRLVGLEDSRYDVTVTLAALDKTYTQRFAGDIKQNQVVYGGITTDFKTESTLTTKEKITQWFSDFFSNRDNILYTSLLTICLVGGVWVMVRYIKRKRLALSR